MEILGKTARKGRFLLSTTLGIIVNLLYCLVELSWCNKTLEIVNYYTKITSMEAQEFFYGVASVALILVSIFIVFFFYVIYQISRLAKTGFRTLNLAARDIQNSLGTMAKSWGKVTLVGVIFRILRTFIFRR